MLLNPKLSEPFSHSLCEDRTEGEEKTFTAYTHMAVFSQYLPFVFWGVFFAFRLATEKQSEMK